jgi:LysM repeat protein
MPTFGTMKLAATFCVTFFSGALLLSTASAQTPSPEPVKTSDATQLEALTEKIDEQNAKIDALSQEILRLEQQISHIRPGTMIGESTPSAHTAAAPAESPSHPMSGNTHTVARGETLTSIAKMYKVGVDELQKANNIEDGRKLQAGQNIMIPGALSPTPSPSPPTD